MIWVFLVLHVIELVLLGWIFRRFHPKNFETSVQPNSEQMTLLKNVGGKWIFHGHRPPNHPDILEAIGTVGLAVMDEAGKINLGKQ